MRFPGGSAARVADLDDRVEASRPDRRLVQGGQARSHVGRNTVQIGGDVGDRHTTSLRITVGHFGNRFGQFILVSVGVALAGPAEL